MHPVGNIVIPNPARDRNWGKRPNRAIQPNASAFDLQKKLQRINRRTHASSRQLYSQPVATLSSSEEPRAATARVIFPQGVESHAYCQTFLEMGQLMSAGGRPDIAEIFFKAGLRQSTGEDHAQFHYAISKLNCAVENWTEALDHLRCGLNSIPEQGTALRVNMLMRLSSVFFNRQQITSSRSCDLCLGIDALIKVKSLTANMSPPPVTDIDTKLRMAVGLFGGHVHPQN